MRIAFDGTTLRPGRTGVGYYTEHLLHHLAQEAPDAEIVVVSNRPIDTTAPLPANVGTADEGWRTPRMVWMQLQAPGLLRGLGADVAHFTNGMMPIAVSVPTVVTIHDMSLTLYPRFHPARRVLLNKPLVDLAARRADAVITVSESARRDIMGLYRLSRDRVHVVHEAAAPSFRPVCNEERIARVRAKYGLGERVILYVGTIEPRKNLPELIDAFAEGWRSGDLRNHQLVCAGPYGWLSRGVEEQLDALQIGDAIRFTGYVPFSELPVLYSLAEVFVFPSMYEGFGLPVIEAMACGTPVVTGRNSSLAEVAGGAIQHVDRLDADALGAAMVSLARDPGRRAELSAKGLRRARMFSWQRAAQETLAIYESVAGRRAGRRAFEAAPAFAEAVLEPLPMPSARAARKSDAVEA